MIFFIFRPHDYSLRPHDRPNCALQAPFWPALGGSRAFLGRSWALLGRSWAALGALVGALGTLGALLNVIWLQPSGTKTGSKPLLIKSQDSRIHGPQNEINCRISLGGVRLWTIVADEDDADDEER